jgi:hypothetical protein
MKRVIGYAVVLAVVVGLVWVGSFGRSGGEQPYAGRFDSQFCMDANGDGGVDISDAVGILSHLFLGSTPVGSCVAQNLSLDDRYVRKSEPIAGDMLADGSVTAQKIGLGGCNPPIGNLCDEISALKQRVTEMERNVSVRVLRRGDDFPLFQDKVTNVEFNTVSWDTNNMFDSNGVVLHARIPGLYYIWGNAVFSVTSRPCELTPLFAVGQPGKNSSLGKPETSRSPRAFRAAGPE